MSLSTNRGYRHTRRILHLLFGKEWMINHQLWGYPILRQTQMLQKKMH